METGEPQPRHAAKLFGVMLLVVVVVAALQPISSHDFWWQLSRGRSVAGGAWTPSRDLLAAETLPEADWLGGVPAYVLDRWLGLTGLMVAKLLVVAFTGFWLLFHFARSRTALALFLVTAGLFAARDAWDPAPLMIDTIGVVLVWVSVERWRDRRTVGGLIAMAVLMCVWANFAPLCLMGIGVAACLLIFRDRADTAPFKTKQAIGALFLMIGASCFTPRGIATLWDSLKMLVPRLTTDAAVLEQTKWQPLAGSFAQAETLSFAALSFALLAMIIVNRISVKQTALFFLVQAFAWTSRANLAPAALWITLLAIEQLRAIEQDGLTAASITTGFVSTAKRVLPIGVTILMVAIGIGQWVCGGDRLGWGIGPRLSGESFEASLANIELQGTAHCVGIREAGLLAWFKPGGIEPYDTPSRALLGGRLAEHLLLNSELSTSWRNRHRRTDGSWGGWWLTLHNRNTTLLVVPSESTTLIRALEPTRWKPLAVEAASLAYGLAGDPACSPRIVKVLELRQFLQQGPWTHTTSSPSGTGKHVDLWGWATGTPNFDNDCRQARVLRAMQLHVAALRVLGPALRFGNIPKVRREFARNQLESAYEERLHMGRSSVFRTVAYLAADDDRHAMSIADDALRVLRSELQTFPQVSVEAYLSGDIPRAIAALTHDNPQQLYASALLTLELGDPGKADILLKQLITNFPNDRLSIAGRNVLQSF